MAGWEGVRGRRDGGLMGQGMDTRREGDGDTGWTVRLDEGLGIRTGDCIEDEGKDGTRGRGLRDGWTDGQDGDGEDGMCVDQRRRRKRC